MFIIWNKLEKQKNKNKKKGKEIDDFLDKFYETKDSVHGLRMGLLHKSSSSNKQNYAHAKKVFNALIPSLPNDVKKALINGFLYTCGPRNESLEKLEKGARG